MYQSAQGLSKRATINASLMQTVSAPTKVYNGDVTAFSIDGTDEIANVESAQFNIEWLHDEGRGVGDAWAFPALVKKNLRLSGTLLAPASSSELFMDTAWGAISGIDVVVSFTINGVTITWPSLISNVSHQINDGAIQRYNFEAIARDPDTGNMPTAPTGSSASLLEEALNGTAAHALIVTNKAATNGISYAGNGLLRNYNLQIPHEGLVTEDVEWASQGAWTATPN